MNIRGNFLFPLLSLASILSLSYAFLDNSMFSLGFSLVHLFLQKRKRVDELQNHFYTNITPNFTQMPIFQCLLFPMCNYIYLNYLPPKIMYIQGKLRWNMWNHGVYQTCSYPLNLLHWIVNHRGWVDIAANFKLALVTFSSINIFLLEV